VDSVFSDVCFERAAESLTAEKLLPALQASLPGALIEILDFSRYAVPAGTLEFKRDGLTPAGFWRGRVVYEGRSAPVWAKVRVTWEQTWVEAIETLAPGRVIEAAQLTIRKEQRAPFGAPIADSVEQIIGRKTARTIRAGEPIFVSMMIAPFDVDKGDKVTVEVASGEARLSFEAVAESGGRAGGTVLIKNPENGRRFQARVDGKGKVSITK
jgi:flagella basal body P-ring formation protein FlgA